MMWNNGYEMMGGSGWDVFFIGMAILIIIGFIAVLVIKLILKNNMKAQSIESPIEILKKRFANGEISKKDYELMKKDIENRFIDNRVI